jgi:surfactin synthase thioesterase subunit
MTELMAPVSGRWFHPSEVDSEARLRLILFHCAGAGAAMWSDWAALLPADIGLQCIQLPGRQERMAEPAFTEMDPLIEALRIELMTEVDDRPYAFLGHSMGAQIAYRLAVAVERAGDVGPALLGACAWAPEGFQTVPPEQADLPEAEVLAWIRSLGSAPAEVFDDPAVVSLVLPAMRSDLAAFASHTDDGATVGCPVVSYSATSDPLLPNGSMASWRARTPSYLGNREFPGGHFFVYEQATVIATDFTRLFQRCA